MAANETIIKGEPGQHDLYIIREFNAPRELVFKAYTTRELYARWIGPKGFKTVFETFEPRNGGSWRYTSHDPNGTDYTFRGVYHEVTAPERIIGTFEFEGPYSYITLGTTTFEALPNDRTRITIQAVHRTVAERDTELKFMTTGVVAGYEALDEVLEGLKAG
jgi:uncharacterized protein YndB with AHSA1/START domain